LLLPVEELAKAPFSLLLAYPRPEEAVLTRRLAELRSLGITHVELGGPKRLPSGLEVLGKGHVGVVVAARLRGRKVALKIRRVDADRASLAHEAEMLALANSVGVGPELLAHTDDFLVMEFIEGPHLPTWLASRPGRRRVAWALRRLLEKCRRLDELGLDHGELSIAHSHVLVEKPSTLRPEPRLVDFESASNRRRPANLTSICQYLFISGLAERLQAILGPVDREALISALRTYKRQMSAWAFEAVLAACGLKDI